MECKLYYGTRHELQQHLCRTTCLQAQDKLKAKGVDILAVVSMDTPFAMHAWSKQLKADDVLFLSDPLGHLAKALDVTFHAGPFGLRSSR